MPSRSSFATIDDYLAAATPVARPILEALRARVRALVPEATETISYQMPAFRLGRTFIYFAAFKQHIGIYPPVSGDPALSAALAPFSNAKGNLRFPLDQALPEALIDQVVLALAGAYAQPAPGHARKRATAA